MSVKKKFVPPRRFDLLTEMIRASHKRERTVPLLRLEDLLRDKPETTPISMH